MQGRAFVLPLQPVSRPFSRPLAGCIPFLASTFGQPLRGLVSTSVFILLLFDSLSQKIFWLFLSLCLRCASEGANFQENQKPLCQAFNKAPHKTRQIFPLRRNTWIILKTHSVSR
jgi:hypothetical protein